LDPEIIESNAQLLIAARTTDAMNRSWTFQPDALGDRAILSGFLGTARAAVAKAKGHRL
jgi:hypothetical protein